MAKILIIDGPRLTGKSTITRELRNRVNYATLMNPTGFPDKGDKGLAKIANYYQQWVDFLEGFKGTDTFFIFDRFMFSEVVFSKLYKDYDFTPYYNRFLYQLTKGGHQIEFLFLDIDDIGKLVRRAQTRNKALFADVEESIEELAKQRQGYRQVKEDLVVKNLPYFNMRHWLIDENNTEELVEEIIERIVEKGFQEE